MTLWDTAIVPACMLLAKLSRRQQLELISCFICSTQWTLAEKAAWQLILAGQLLLPMLKPCAHLLHHWLDTQLHCQCVRVLKQGAAK